MSQVLYVRSYRELSQYLMRRSYWKIHLRMEDRKHSIEFIKQYKSHQKAKEKYNHHKYVMETIENLMLIDNWVMIIIRNWIQRNLKENKKQFQLLYV